MDGLEVLIKALAVKVHFDADISKWDTGKVTYMYAMFYHASAFNQDIGSWNTAQVTTMQSYVCFRFCVQPRHWELEHRESDEYAIYVSSASAFNQDIGDWNTAHVTDMGFMFKLAFAFNHDISSWTGTAATTAQTEMFSGATAFQAKFTCTNADTGPANSCACTKCIPDASWHAFVCGMLSLNAGIWRVH